MVRDINGLNPAAGSNTNAANTNKSRSNDNNVQADQQVQAKSLEKDTVEISDTARAVSAATDKIKSLPDVDMDRVSAIKSALNNGSYNVDADSVAGKMIDANSF